MDSRLTTILFIALLLAGLLLSGQTVLKYYGTKQAAAHAARFRTELARISTDLGTSASKVHVTYSYRRGEPVKDTIDHMARQSGVPLAYSGTAATKSAISYSGKLAGALTNFCVSEGLVVRKTTAGTFEVVPK